MESLGRLLTVHADELVVRWLAVVSGERLGRHGLSTAALKDSLAQQLRAIGEAIQVGASSPAGLTFSKAQHGEAALPPHRLWGIGTPVDAEERVRQEVPIEEVVDEYAFVVDVVRSWIEERGVEVPPKEFSFFHSAIFGLVAESVRRYSLFKEQRVAREKAQFVASIAHQMRTPLSALTLKAHAIEHKQPLPDSADFDVLRRNVRRLQFLVEGVLRLERSQVSEIPVRLVPLEVEGFIQEMMADFRDDAEQKGLRVDVEADPALRAELDPDLLTDALGNFVSNAIRYTEHGFVRVSLEQVDDRIVCRVTDSGPGLSEEQRNRLSAPLQPSRPGSYGLGLVIAYPSRPGARGRRVGEEHPWQGHVLRVLGSTTPAAKCRDRLGCLRGRHSGSEM